MREDLRLEEFLASHGRIYPSRCKIYAGKESREEGVEGIIDARPSQTSAENPSGLRAVCINDPEDWRRKENARE